MGIGDWVMTPDALLADNGAAVPAGSSGQIVGFQGRSPIVHWMIPEGETSGLADPDRVRVSPRAVRAPSSLKGAFGAMAARRSGKRRS